MLLIVSLTKLVLKVDYPSIVHAFHEAGWMMWMMAIAEKKRDMEVATEKVKKNVQSNVHGRRGKKSSSTIPGDFFKCDYKEGCNDQLMAHSVTGSHLNATKKSSLLYVK